MSVKKFIIIVIVLGGLGLLGTAIYQRLNVAGGKIPDPASEVRVIPVEVDPVRQERIDQVRSFTGTLDASQDFIVAAKVSGRVEEITVDLADVVERGQVVARLDNDESIQALAQAEADLAVAQANFGEANSQLKIAERELSRIETLRQRGVSSESDMDEAQANQLAKAALLEVTRAQVARANATVETARIRLNYSDVVAGWQGGGDHRIVAERFVDVGATISENQSLLRIVELDPLIAVFHVTERDYGLLAPNQLVSLQTDAYPDDEFEGRIVRIAPVFRESSRQARVELTVENPDRRLKPGMFVRATVVLDSVDNAVVIPESALLVRDGQTGVFRLDDGGETVSWFPVTPGIRQGDSVQAKESDLTGEVVTLGQQLLEDGSGVTVPREKLQ